MNEQWEKYYYTEYLPSLSKTVVNAYDNQQLSGWIILSLVSLLCISGVVLAALQLYWSKEALKYLKNETEISASGIKIVSPFVGVLILALSFSFFYMYVKEVYTIRSDGAASVPPAAPRNQAVPPY
jgi:uncharacterized BrkB/YihY/UPF0761 family membrane protein